MSAPHDRPTASELIEAVREFLERDVLTATEGRVQFHTRVAIRVLATVERELAGPGQAEAVHQLRLESLGFTSDEELGAAIRAGALDDRMAEVRAAVFDSVIEKLRVANPDYLADPDDLEDGDRPSA
jgi:hypothetical protein